MLKSKLYELELRKRNEAKQALEDSKTDIGWGHQIRSYVLDQSRIKDLRTNVEIGNTQARARRRPRRLHQREPETGRAAQPASEPDQMRPRGTTWHAERCPATPAAATRTRSSPSAAPSWRSCASRATPSPTTSRASTWPATLHAAYGAMTKEELEGAAGRASASPAA